MTVRTKAQLKASIASSSAGPLVGGTILSDMVDSYSDDAPTQRSITSTPSILPSDRILNVNLSSPGSVTVPPYGSRAGAHITFKMLTTSSQLTINATSPDTFDGQTSLPLFGGQTLTLVPFNDGVNAGYSIQ